MSSEPDFRKFNPKPTWNSRGGDNLVEDFYKPALKNCKLYNQKHDPIGGKKNAPGQEEKNDPPNPL